MRRVAFLYYVNNAPDVGAERRDPDVELEIQNKEVQIQMYLSRVSRIEDKLSQVIR